MPITCELVRIPTATQGALPVNFAALSTHPPWTAWLPTSFRRHFLFTKLRQERPDRPDRCLLQLLLHLVDDLFTLFTL